MVDWFSDEKSGTVTFQYSLCRVVLMVLFNGIFERVFAILSVLALSSRFDGRVVN